MTSVLGHAKRLNVRDNLLLIDGEWRTGEGEHRWKHTHPSTNEIVAGIAIASEGEVDRAVRAARKAFDQGPWPSMAARDRRRILQRISDLFAAHADELTELQTLDNNVPISVGRDYLISGECVFDVFAHHAGWVDKICGEVYPRFTDKAPQFVSLREPVGVVVGITPFNAPVLQIPEKIAPALAAGCCFILKPSENASLVAIRMAELIAEADLPPGVFQLLTGDATTGDTLIRHPGVDKIAFTGSRAVGEHIQRVAARGIKRVTLELGGKSAAIVMPDCGDLRSTSMGVMAQLSMGLSGQVCSITSRALVHHTIYDQFLEYAAEQITSVRRGDPFDPATTSAPLISKRQVDKVIGYIEDARNEGARLVFGGERPSGSLAAGNWVDPTLFADVDNQMKIAREEVFGPVLAAIPFKDEEEAIAIANDSDYGLSAVLHTTDVGRAWRMGRALRTGTVGIGGYTFMPNSPFGGFKASGLGREGGFSSIEAFTEVKTLIFTAA